LISWGQCSAIACAGKSFIQNSMVGERSEVKPVPVVWHFGRRRGV